MTPLRRALSAALLVWCLGAALPAAARPAHPRFVTTAVTTYYDLSGVMADGAYVHDGAAACPRAYMGATVHVLGPDVWEVCEDTGAAWAFEAGYFRLDVWAPSRPWWLQESYYDVEVTWQ